MCRGRGKPLALARGAWPLKSKQTLRRLLALGATIPLTKLFPGYARREFVPFAATERETVYFAQMPAICSLATISVTLVVPWMLMAQKASHPVDKPETEQRDVHHVPHIPLGGGGSELERYLYSTIKEDRDERYVIRFALARAIPRYERNIDRIKAVSIAGVFTNLVESVPPETLYNARAIHNWVPARLLTTNQESTLSYNPLSTEVNYRLAKRTISFNVAKLLVDFAESVCSSEKLIRKQGFGNLVDASCAASGISYHALQYEGSKFLTHAERMVWLTIKYQDVFAVMKEQGVSLWDLSYPSSQEMMNSVGQIASHDILRLKAVAPSLSARNLVLDALKRVNPRYQEELLVNINFGPDRR